MSELRQLLEREMERIRPPSFTDDDVRRRRDRMVRTRRVAAAITALAVFVATVAWLSWGIRPRLGREPAPASRPTVQVEPTRAEVRAFRAAFGERCFRLVARLEAVPLLVTGPPEETVRGFRSLARFSERLVAEIGPLQPNGDEEAAHIVQRFEEVATRSKALVRSAGELSAQRLEEMAHDAWLFLSAAIQSVAQYGIRGCPV